MFFLIKKKKAKIYVEKKSEDTRALKEHFLQIFFTQLCAFVVTKAESIAHC